MPHSSAALRREAQPCRCQLSIAMLSRRAPRAAGRATQAGQPCWLELPGPWPSSQLSRTHHRVQGSPGSRVELCHRLRPGRAEAQHAAQQGLVAVGSLLQPGGQVAAVIVVQRGQLGHLQGSQKLRALGVRVLGSRRLQPSLRAGCRQVPTRTLLGCTPAPAESACTRRWLLSNLGSWPSHKRKLQGCR